MGNDCTEDFLVMTLKGIEYTAKQATAYFFIPHIL